MEAPQRIDVKTDNKVEKVEKRKIKKVVKKKVKKKENITVTVSFKSNVTDRAMYDWLELNSQIIGKSGYIKQLIKADMENSNHSN